MGDARLHQVPCNTGVDAFRSICASACRSTCQVSSIVIQQAPHPWPGAQRMYKRRCTVRAPIARRTKTGHGVLSHQGQKQSTPRRLLQRTAERVQAERPAQVGASLPYY